MAPEILIPAERPPEEEQKPRRRSRQFERLHELEEKRRNPFSGLTPEEQKRVAERSIPQVSEQVKKEEPAKPPPIPPVRMAASKEASASASASSPQTVETRQTVETTKVEKLDLGHIGASGKYEEVEGHNTVVVQELDKIERTELPQEKDMREKTVEQEQVRRQLGKLREVEKARVERLEKDRKEGIVVPQTKLEESEQKAGPIPETGKEEEKLAREQASSTAANIKKEGLKLGKKEEEIKEIKRTLDEAMEKNRPALVMQAVVKKQEEGPLDLMQLDEKKAQMLTQELDNRIELARKEQTKFENLIKKEKNEGKKRALRLKLRKIIAHLAFYSKVKGMLGRLLGGFFGKLAGGLMK